MNVPTRCIASVAVRPARLTAVLALMLLTSCTAGGEHVRTTNPQLPASNEDSLVLRTPGKDTTLIDSVPVPMPGDTLSYGTARVRHVIDSLYYCPVCKVNFADYTGPLSELEVKGLMIALNDVYRNWAQYDWISSQLADFPYTEIRDSYRASIESIRRLLRDYAVLIPDNPWENRVVRYTDLHAACVDMTRKEQRDLRVFPYLEATTRRKEILAIYGSLREAALRQHLPELQKCAGF